MSVWSKIGLGSVALTAGGVAAGYRTHRRTLADAEAAYARVAAPAAPPTRRFDLEQLIDLPEIARRYFRHAIAPGTALYSAVELEMVGTFLLRDKDSFRTFHMTARQVLRAPDQFVWMPRLRAGPVSITGSDALVEGEAWTRFWLMGLVPVAQERSSPDLVRSAQFRAAVESGLWIPASLLPEKEVEWEQVGPDEAQVTLKRFRPEIVLRLKLGRNGAVREVVGQRWSNANTDKAFRLQPFGGTIAREQSFQGLTIPTSVSVGNQFGSDDYLPFFQATIRRAVFR